MAISFESLLADLLQALGQCDTIELVERQAQEELDAVLQPVVRLKERLALVFVAAFDGCRILNAPPPAEYALKRGAPIALIITSARIERAELPVRGTGY
jgi:hypothetical protein